MTDGPTVTVRFDALDKAALIEIATRLQRSQSDVLRGLVRETLKVLQEQEVHIKRTMNPPARVSTRRIKLNS